MARTALLASASYHLIALARDHRAQLGRALAELGVSPGQELVLAHLWRDDGPRLTELADRLEVTAPAITKTVRRMERSGLLRRMTDPEDARVTRVALTERGAALRPEIEDRWDAVERRLLASLTSEQADRFRRLLRTARG